MTFVLHVKDGLFRISLPGSGSDYAPFRDRLGVPCVDIRYTYDTVGFKFHFRFLWLQYNLII